MSQTWKDCVHKAVRLSLTWTWTRKCLQKEPQTRPPFHKYVYVYIYIYAKKLSLSLLISKCVHFYRLRNERDPGSNIEMLQSKGGVILGIWEGGWAQAPPMNLKVPTSKLLGWKPRRGNLAGSWKPELETRVGNQSA